jgi:hypothetical protein
MESSRVYEEAYNKVVKLLGEASTSKVTIDYSKLDEKTATELKKAIHAVLSKRKSELWATIETSQI